MSHVNYSNALRKRRRVHHQALLPWSGSSHPDTAGLVDAQRFLCESRCLAATVKIPLDLRCFWIQILPKNSPKKSHSWDWKTWDIGPVPLESWMARIPPWKLSDTFSSLFKATMEHDSKVSLCFRKCMTFSRLWGIWAPSFDSAPSAAPAFSACYGYGRCLWFPGIFGAG